jgi:hypothetical protein
MKRFRYLAIAAMAPLALLLTSGSAFAAPSTTKAPSAATTNTLQPALSPPNSAHLAPANYTSQADFYRTTGNNELETWGTVWFDEAGHQALVKGTVRDNKWDGWCGQTYVRFNIGDVYHENYSPKACGAGVTKTFSFTDSYDPSVDIQLLAVH